MKNNHKGIEKGVEMVIIIVVLMILAVTLVVFFSSSIKKGQTTGENTIEGADTSIKYNLCKLKCDQYLNSGSAAAWDSYQPDGNGKNSCSDANVFGPCA